MTKCALGPKKIGKIESIFGYAVRSAYVRGSWEHFWAEVWFENLPSIPFTREGRPTPMVNYKTGEIDWGEFDQGLLEREGRRIVPS